MPADALAAAGWALTILTVGVLAFGAYSIEVTGWVQHRDQSHLRATLAKTLTLAQVGGEHNAGFFARKGTGPAPAPARSRAVALLAIPALGLTDAVLDGVTPADLSEGPGWYRGTAEPGGLGDSVIAGHRTLDGAPFYRLDRLRRGDAIAVTTAKGHFVYSVVSVNVVEPGERSALRSFGDRRLTLVTGDPVFRESHPLVVEALLTSSTHWPWAALPLAVTPGRDPLTPEVPGDPTAWLAVLLGALVVLVAASAPSQLAKRHPESIDLRAGWIVAAPFVLLGIYVSFHALTQVLPATV